MDRMSSTNSTRRELKFFAFGVAAGAIAVAIAAASPSTMRSPALGSGRVMPEAAPPRRLTASGRFHPAGLVSRPDKQAAIERAVPLRRPLAADSRWRGLWRKVRMRVTAYCPCEKCCGKFADGVTASGKPVTANGGCFVAAPPEFPLASLVRVPGYAGGRAVEVLDRGGAIKDNRLDVYFATHAQALRWGVRWLDVQVKGAEQ